MEHDAPRRDTPIILVVDDTALARRAARKTLEQVGFVVEEATTGNEALATALASRPDLITLDIELPDISGLEVARRLKDHGATSRIPVIHVSATRVSGLDLVRGLDSGADAYLSHPVDPQVLVSTVRALLRLKTAMDRTAALQSLTARLSSATTAMDVAEALLDGVFAAGARAGALAMTSRDGGQLDIAGASAEWPAALSGDSGHLPAGASSPLSICAWSGAPVWITSRAALAEDYPHLLAPGVGAVACLPLAFGGSVRGVLGLLFASDGTLSDLARSLSATVATECALALERIHLRQIERQALELAERVAVRERAARIALERVEEALRRSLRAREDMLAIVSHDLRNPLSSIMMNADLAKARLAAGKPARVVETADSILRAADQMNTLIGDLLDAASIESGHFTLRIAPAPIAALVHAAVAVLAPVAEAKSIVLRGEVEGAPLAACDRNRVAQALSNLLGNALKFTSAGGSIVLRAAVEGERVVVSVTDTGQGIAPEQIPRLFDRYWKGHEGAGAGLGLFIVNGIVEAHGERLTIESQLGQGTRISFNLPLDVFPSAVAD